MIASRTELPEGLRTVDEALHRTRFRILPFLGPAFIACVAYIDPGNFATNIAGGSRFGYRLVWVIVAANLMAMLIQTLSAKVGIATGRNLPELCRERFSHRTTVFLWIQAELIAMATDLAEFLGAAIGFQLLFGWALFPSALLSGVAAFLILGMQRFGFRAFEAVIAVLVGVIGACYIIELTFAHADYGEVFKHAVEPQFGSGEALLLAVGIIGATVMPHVIYLHSALTQDRLVPETDEDARTLLRYTRVDVVIAMTIAGVINVSMLVMAASTFYRTGLFHIASLDTAHKTLATDPRQRLGRDLRACPDRLRPLELGRRDAVRPGRDAGIHPPSDSGHRATTRHDDPRVRGDRHRCRPVAHARSLPGGALVRDPVRTHPARHLHGTQRHHGTARQPSHHDGRGDRRHGADRRAERLPAAANLRRGLSDGNRRRRS